MAEKQTNKERLKDITDSIERGIQDLFQSDKYVEYLRTMSRFHKYSVNNTRLIYMQKPDATLVAGFNKWRDQFERNVMKGEKGIKIIAPTPYKKKIEQEKRDPDTNLPMLDADGKVITEEKEIKIPMFKPVTVFDVSQTDGKPLPQLASNLTGDVQNFDVFMEALRRTSPVPIDIKPIADGADGFFSLDNQRITIREGMSEVQTVSAVVHEIAHSKLHNQKKIEEPKGATKYQEVEIFDVPALFSNGRIATADIPEGLYRYDLRGSDDDPGMPVTVEQSVMVNHAGTILTPKPLELGEDGRLTLTEDEGLNFVGGEISAYQFLNEQRKDRNTEEVEAESISFAVCAYYGIATGENSFGYIATWSKDKELKELRASLETINKTSSELISDIDRHYAEITKEREAVVEVAEPNINEPVLQSETEEALYLVDDTVYLHVQHTDEGWDYSLYGKETKKLIDGGIIDPADVESSPVSSLAGTVRTEVFALQGMTPTKVFFEDIAVLDELLAAQQIQAEKPLDEMNILEMVDFFMEQGINEEQANDLAHAEWQARDVRQRGNEVVEKERLDTLYAENPIGDDDWFYNHPDSMAFEAVYFNPDSNAGGQYVIMTLPYELISDAVEQTNDTQSFFEFLEKRASYTELVDITDEDFHATMENYKNRSADFIGRSQEAMEGIIKTVANEVNDPVLTEYLGETVDEIARDVEEIPPEQAPDNGYMPDPSVSIESMNAYGYTDSDMLPLSKERALELFERDVPVYMLYGDNSEGMAFEAEDIVLFSGCFGISREDWDAIKEEVPSMDMELIRKKREQAFLESAADTYAIYQLKNESSTAILRFESYDRLQKQGFEPNHDNYELVYSGMLNHDGSKIDCLEDLYRKFNIERPDDFTGHSLSVSDIVALKQRGVVSYHYVDSIGYKELPTFMKPENYLKNAEMQMEDDYGMLDGIINNGPKEAEKPVTKTEETKSKKPSVLAKLRQYQAEDRKEKSMQQCAERDL